MNEKGIGSGCGNIHTWRGGSHFVLESLASFQQIKKQNLKKICHASLLARVLIVQHVVVDLCDSSRGKYFHAFIKTGIVQQSPYGPVTQHSLHTVATYYTPLYN